MIFSNKTKSILIALSIVIELLPHVKATNIEFNNEKQLLDISSRLQIFEDKSNNISFNKVIQENFTTTTSLVPNLGISTSDFWIKIPITNNTNIEKLFLELSLSIIDYIEFYYPIENGQYEIIRTGDAYPFYDRKYNDPYYLFDLDISKGESKIYYLKVTSNEAIQLPIKIGTQTNIYTQIKNRDILSGIYIGIMLVMIFYNLFIYFSVRDKSYIYYVVYILCILLTQTSLQGYTLQYLWFNNSVITKYSLIILPSLSAIMGMFFMNFFLQTKKYSKKLNKVVFFLVAPYFFAIGLSLFNIFGLSQIIIQVNSGVVSLYMLITPIIVYKKGYQPAKYFLAAWSVFLVGVVIYILKDFEVLPFNNFTRYTMQIGSGIETVLLSFALAARINIYKKERLEAVQENEKLVREQNVILEQKVIERTNELNKALNHLKQTQSQLVEAEKMASLGQLTAGIAHEVNNPINFITSNIFPLREDIKDLKSILNKYAEINSATNLSEKLQEIEQLKDELQYEYLLEELEGIIHGIEDGAKRTAEIVSSLRNFSRLDESDLKRADINDGINSTLKLIKIKLGNIKLVKKLGKTPEIECYPGKLNQLFLNLIDNAIFAVKAKHQKSKDGEIIIETYVENNFLIIKISDNGTGMNQETKNKIFEPFFTTKDVGEGTGLGLSIVHGIIETHKAKIDVTSQLGIGTEFKIKLPV